MENYHTEIAEKLGKERWQIANALSLFQEGATIPFISRYRKEKTGGLSDIELIEIEKLFKQLEQLNKRKEAVLKSLREQGLLTGNLKQQIEEAETLAKVEDIYLPYKPKRKTRATIAKSKGLEPLAKMIYSENIDNPVRTAVKFINNEKDVNTKEEAIQGALDIIAEWISENGTVRDIVRNQFHKNAYIISKPVKGKENEQDYIKYKAYFDWEEKASSAPSHRLLAMFRGEKAGILKLKIEPDKNYVESGIGRLIIKKHGKAGELKGKALKDSLKRLIFHSMETELRNELKSKADEEAIRVFSENLKQLLLAPPLGRKNILAIDPGFRTGCKIVCLDRNGNLKHNETIYPHPPQNKKGEAIKKIKSLVNAYNIEAIAIGNGTAGRETEDLIRHIRFDRDLIAVMVNENGASVYSASETAREEFPEYDVTVRGAVSIGRRLMDPLSELVKIDPKSIGVGQYQHDVNQKLLHESLTTTVELCVNAVGVDLNSASKELLTYVSGLGPVLASNIIEYRKKHGDFKSREELKNVKGLGEKAFKQSAGFLRIKNGVNILDSSAVHPESYHIVEKISEKTGIAVKELIGNHKILDNLNLNDFVTDETGLPTLNDIINELKKPGRDPRKHFKQFEFDKNIRKIEDLKEGMILNGIVTNITNFGAFIDIGIHENGLLHKSKIADEFVNDPADYLKINQELKVMVVGVDINSKRISLSLKDVKR